MLIESSRACSRLIGVRFFVVAERLGLGIEAYVAAEAAGNIAQVAHGAGKPADLDVGRLGIDVPAAVRRLGGCIFHCHAKDTFIDRRNTAENGCLDGKPYTEVRRRSWTFRTVGWGHGLEVWREIASALRTDGYDYVLSIEHEDPLVAPDEGLRHSVAFLRQAMLVEKAGEMWWAS